MAEEVVLNINVNGAASVGEVKDLKQQFAEAEDALFKLAGAGKDGTKEFHEAQIEAAKLKERVDDINESLDDLKPEAKLGAFSKVAGGLASGFTAATGAAALFGSESEDLQKQLVKVQAAMAFSEGLRGLGDLADGFKTLKTVILANPLFLITSIVVGIGAALFALKDKIAFVGKAFDGLSSALDFVIDKVKEFTDWLGISDFKAEAVKDNTIRRNEEIIASNDKRYDKEIRAAKRAGEATEQLEIDKATANRTANEAIIASLDSRVESEAIRIEELKAINEEYTESILDFEAVKQRKFKETEKVKAEEWAKEQERKAKEIADAEAADIKADEDLFALVEAAQAEQERLDGIDEQRRLRDEKRLADKKEAEDKYRDEQIAAAEAAQARQDEIDAQELVKIDEKTQRTQQGLKQAEQITNLFFANKLNNAEKGSKAEEEILKKQFKVNQAFQVANALVGGAAAVVKGIAQFGPPPSPPGIAAIASAVLATGIQVATIKSQKFQGGGGSVSAPTAAATPTFSSTAATTPQPITPTGQQASTLINDDGTIGAAETPIVKAVVVETDITKSQKNVKSIEDMATF